MIKKVIYLNAGHFAGDPGASSNNLIERDEVIKIRDLLLPLLEKQFKVYVIPDDKNLQQSVKYVNGLARKLNDGLAIDLHMNAGGAKGAECFYYSWSVKEKSMAKKLINKYCEITNLENRGAKPDSKSAGKYLYWIKKTNPWALLLEMCFIDSKDDADYFRSNRDQVAKAIYVGICDIFGIKAETKIDIKNKIAWHFGQGIKLLKQL